MDLTNDKRYVYSTEIQLKGTNVTPRRRASLGHFTFCMWLPGVCQHLQGYPSSHERHQFPLSVAATLTANLNREWLSSAIRNSV